jgi:hypothetical protein
LLERLLLRLHADAAEDHGRAQRQVLAVCREALADLRGQLARRREHEAADVPMAAGRPSLRRGLSSRANTVSQALQDRQRERGGLAGPGLRQSQEVTPGEHVRNRARLDRCRFLVAFRRHRLGDRRDQPQLSKLHRTGGIALPRPDG